MTRHFLHSGEELTTSHIFREMFKLRLAASHPTTLLNSRGSEGEYFSPDRIQCSTMTSLLTMCNRQNNVGMHRLQHRKKTPADDNASQSVAPTCALGKTSTGSTSHRLSESQLVSAAPLQDKGEH